jgi:hypothetical protein
VSNRKIHGDALLDCCPDFPGGLVQVGARLASSMLKIDVYEKDYTAARCGSGHFCRCFGCYLPGPRHICHGQRKTKIDWRNFWAWLVGMGNRATPSCEKKEAARIRCCQKERRLKSFPICRVFPLLSQPTPSPTHPLTPTSPACPFSIFHFEFCIYNLLPHLLAFVFFGTACAISRRAVPIT